MSEAVQQVERRARQWPSFKVIRWLFHFGIGVALLWWIFYWVDIDVGGLQAAVTKASYLDLGLAFIFFALSFVLKTIQFRVCAGLSTSKAHLLGVFLFQNMLLTVLPWRIGELSVPVLLLRN